MEKQILSLNNQRKIHLYDDLFDYTTRSDFYRFCTTSLFKIDGSDNQQLEFKEHLSLVSIYNRFDVERFGILNLIPDDIKDNFGISLDTMLHAMINLCTPLDRFHVHSDNSTPTGVTLLYYCNVTWNVEWGGDTLFLDETCSNIEFTSQYKPGRLVIFDSRIPHLIRPSTTLSPYYRFSFAAKFDV